MKYEQFAACVVWFMATIQLLVNYLRAKENGGML